MLEQAFRSAMQEFNVDEQKTGEFFSAIVSAHSGSKRHYHNLAHLEHLIRELHDCRTLLENWNCLVLATAYHDYIYDSKQSDNEEKSAALAVGILESIHAPEDFIARCNQHILFTKKHEFRADGDTNFFTDADLSILGSSPDQYITYTQGVRKEYSIYPDFLYKPGRKKVLRHFLSMQEIFKTAYFRNKYENAARLNIETELATLS